MRLGFARLQIFASVILLSYDNKGKCRMHKKQKIMDFNVAHYNTLKSIKKGSLLKFINRE